MNEAARRRHGWPGTACMLAQLPALDARARRRSVEWRAVNSLADHDAVTRFLHEHPEPAMP